MSTWPYGEDRIEIGPADKIDLGNIGSSLYDDIIAGSYDSDGRLAGIGADSLGSYEEISKKSLTNRFDLEQEILNCWRVVDDLKILYENVLENSTLDKDEVANILIGLSQLYEMRFDKTFRIFEECITNKKI
jgi:hypothetical protein